MSEVQDNGLGRHPSPEGGWSEEIVTLERAVVVPPVISSFTQPTGVMTADGDYVQHGSLWRGVRPLTTKPEFPTEEPEVLEGRWLWGGVLWAHFGHFLTESAARIWALNELDEEPDGILFVPKRPKVGAAIRPFHNSFVDLMSKDLPIKVATQPLSVEKLIVPGQGFGLGLISNGTQKYRDAIHARFGRDVEPEGPEKLYISRSALGLGKGGLLGENHLEDLLKEEGYEIFHPEKHDFNTQIARYKAAKQVIAADGSALHLFAMVGRPDQSVAMILRRISGATGNLAKHVESFCGRKPLIVSALRTEWIRAGQTTTNRMSVGELDHGEIAKALIEGGFISEGAEWHPLRFRDRRREMRRRGMGRAVDFVEAPAYAAKRRAETRKFRQERRRLAAEQEQQEANKVDQD